jgi:hypothetical protein
VTVHLTREDGNAIVSVADTGEGIPPELLPHVFERFRQGDSTSTRSHGGLGLGLAIVRHVVELHRGSVHAGSAGPGRGATFTVRLPLAAETAPAAAFFPKRALSGRPFAAGPILAGLRILLVEDDAVARASIAAVLEECDGCVTLAASVEQALEGLRRAQFDVVVSDIAMPGEDGYGLLRRLRAATSQPPDVPPSRSRRTRAPRTGSGRCARASTPTSRSRSTRRARRYARPAALSATCARRLSARASDCRRRKKSRHGSGRARRCAIVRIVKRVGRDPAGPRTLERRRDGGARHAHAPRRRDGLRVAVPGGVHETRGRAAWRARTPS